MLQARLLLAAGVLFVSFGCSSEPVGSPESTGATDPQVVALSGAVAKSRICGEVDRSSELGFWTVQVDAGTLVGLKCDLAAYNFTYRFASWDGVRLESLAMPIFLPGFDDVELTDSLIATTDDPGGDETGRFTLHTKGVGHGGCGWTATYRFDGVAASLVLVRGHGCDGRTNLPPDHWPVIYRQD